MPAQNTSCAGLTIYAGLFGGLQQQGNFFACAYIVCKGKSAKAAACCIDLGIVGQCFLAVSPSQIDFNPKKATLSFALRHERKTKPGIKSTHACQISDTERNQAESGSSRKTARRF